MRSLMIYPAETDIVPFVKSLVSGLKPYALSNDVGLSFSSGMRKQVVYYQPLSLSQSIVQLLCNIINLLPPKSKIKVRLRTAAGDENVRVEVENTGINLIRINELCAKSTYPFTGSPLANGTLYRLLLPLRHPASSVKRATVAPASVNHLPPFYREIQKRFQSHFTQAEKRMATLAQDRPKEAAFLQKINALINVNLENENFDTAVLCKAMSLTRTQLFRRLKSLIEQAPAAYIKTLRLQRAKELLETTAFTVSEITFKTGFQSVSHFTKIFKKHYGILPSVFQRGVKPATNE